MAYLDHISNSNIRYELYSKPIADNIADEFSAQTDYTIGDYVFYNQTLYKFTSAHSVGAWNASHVTEVAVGGELNDLKGAHTGR